MWRKEAGTRTDCGTWRVYFNQVVGSSGLPSASVREPASASLLERSRPDHRFAHVARRLCCSRKAA